MHVAERDGRAEGAGHGPRLTDPLVWFMPTKILGGAKAAFALGEAVVEPDFGESQRAGIVAFVVVRRL